MSKKHSFFSFLPGKVFPPKVGEAFLKAKYIKVLFHKLSTTFPLWNKDSRHRNYLVNISDNSECSPVSIFLITAYFSCFKYILIFKMYSFFALDGSLFS